MYRFQLIIIYWCSSVFKFVEKNIFQKVAELEGKATGLLSAAEKYDLKVV